MKELVAVVIPVYREICARNDRKSLEQCLKVLGSHPIIITCAPSFDCREYKLACEKNGITFRKTTFDAKYFQSREGYNSLCMSSHFWNAFAAFEFVLIYQLDAWVFRDELQYWCGLGWDYIGAPYPVDFDAREKDVVFRGVGNGGFSLRRVASMVESCSAFHRIYGLKQLLNGYGQRARRNPLIWCYCLLRSTGFRNNLQFLKHGKWEDHFFFEVARLTGLIRLPPESEALRFSFEYRPSAAFAVNGNRLPMGCHAWERIEYEEFWSTFIR